MPELIYAPAYTNISLNLFLRYRVWFIAFFQYNSNRTNYSQPALSASYSIQSWGGTIIIWLLSIWPLPITVSGIDKNGKEALPWIYGIFGDKLLIDVDCHIEKKYGFNSQTGEMEEYESEIPDYGVITADSLFSDNL